MKDDPTISEFVRFADKHNMTVRFDLTPRTSSDWLNDRVYSVTARVYCKCGDAAQFTAAWMSIIEKVGDFWHDHHGEEHGPTTPEICGQARRRRQKGKKPRSR